MHAQCGKKNQKRKNWDGGPPGIHLTFTPLKKEKLGYLPQLNEKRPSGRAFIREVMGSPRMLREEGPPRDSRQKKNNWDGKELRKRRYFWRNPRRTNQKRH